MARGAVACATIDSAGRPHEVILQPTVQLEPGWCAAMQRAVARWRWSIR